MARQDRRKHGSPGHSGGPPLRVPDAVRRSLAALQAQVEYDQALDATVLGQRSKALREEGHELSRRRMFSEAHARYVEAARLFSPDDDSPAAAICWYDLGQSYDDLPSGVREENLLHAKELFERSSRSPARQRTPLRIAMTHDAIGRVMRALAEVTRSTDRRALDEAERHLRLACTIAEGIGPAGLRDAAGYLHNLGNLQTQRGRANDAELSVRRAFKLADEARRDPHGFAEMLPPQMRPMVPSLQRTLARILIQRGRRGDLGPALALLTEVLYAGDPELNAEAHLLSAEALLAHRPPRADEARGHLRAIDLRSLPRARRAEYVTWLRRAGDDVTARSVLELAIGDALQQRSVAMADHASDHPASDAQEFSLQLAQLHADEGRHVDAFLALEATAALRYMERVHAHARFETDAISRALWTRHIALSGVAITLDQIASLLSRVPDREASDLLDKGIRRFEQGLDAASDRSSKSLLAREGFAATLDAHWQALRLMRGAKEAASIPTALHDGARSIADEALRARDLLAARAPAKYLADLSPTDVLDSARLRTLLEESPGDVFLRVHLGAELFAVCVWLEQGAVAGRTLRRALNPREVSAVTSLYATASAGGLDRGAETPSLSDALATLLPTLDVSAALPDGAIEHLVVLPSRLAALLPWAASGARGATLLDRAGAISYLPNLTPRVMRQRVAQSRAGGALVAPGACCDPPTAFHGVAFAKVGADEETLFEERATRDEVLRCAATADVVSIYTHGIHVAGEGAELALAGCALSLDDLGAGWVGCERVELWACQSGVNVPTDMLTPWVDEAFGIDVAFHYVGVRSTIGSLWSVPAFVTSHLAHRYREALREHGDAPRALADAQRWWRDRVVSSLPDLLARTPEAELSDAVAALLGTRASHDDLARTLGPMRADARLPPQEQARLVRMFTSPEAWAGFRFLGVAERRPEVVPGELVRALTDEERSELDALLAQKPDPGQDVDEAHRERLLAATTLAPDALPTPAQALAVARAYAERGLGSMRHNLLRGLAWVHEALADSSISERERSRLFLEAACLWTELARGELDAEQLRPVYRMDAVLLARAREALSTCESEPEAPILSAWIERLTDGKKVMSTAKVTARWSALRDAVSAYSDRWRQLRAGALAIEWLLIFGDLPDVLIRDAIEVAERLLAPGGSRDSWFAAQRLRNVRSTIALRVDEVDKPRSPYSLSAREIARGAEWVARMSAPGKERLIDPQQMCSTAIDRLEGMHWGTLNDGLDDLWDSSGAPGLAWQRVTGAYLSGRFAIAPEPRLAAHHIASLQLGANLRLGTLHRMVRRVPHTDGLPDPGDLMWRRERALDSMEDLARLPEVGPEVHAPEPSRHDAFRMSASDLMEAGTRSPWALTAWDAASAFGREGETIPAARTLAFLLERHACALDEMIHDMWRSLRTGIGAVEGRSEGANDSSAREFLEQLAPPRRIADLETALVALPEGVFVLGVSIGSAGELLLSLAGTASGKPVLRTFRGEVASGWEAREALARTLVSRESDAGPTRGVDASRAVEFASLREHFDELLGRLLDDLPRDRPLMLAVFSPGPLRPLPWGSLTAAGRPLRQRFVTVTSLPWLGFESVPESGEGDGSRVLCALGDDPGEGETRFGGCAVRSLRAWFRDIAPAEQASDVARGSDIVESERLEALADRVEVVRWYGVGTPFTMNSTTEGMHLARGRTLSARNLAGTRLPRCHRVEYWAATGGNGVFYGTAMGERDVFPSLVGVALAAGARGVLDLAWPVHDLVKALVCERFGVVAQTRRARGSAALGIALREVDALLARWERDAGTLGSTHDALAWLDEARRSHAREAGLDAEAVVAFAPHTDARCVAVDVAELVRACSSPEQLGAFRWWGL